MATSQYGGYYYVSGVAAPPDTGLAALASHSPSVSLERFRYYNVDCDIMDSNSNSCDMFSPKIEIDSESEKEYSRRDSTKPYWNSENTMKLIETMEKECKELWDLKNPLNKDRTARHAKLEYLADMFGTTAEEISRKVHNLRTQFNNELRKIKRRQVVRSGWEYFEALSFLTRTPAADPLEAVDAVNLELAEFQADEEEEFGAAARAHVNLIVQNSSGGSPSRCRVGKAGHQSSCVSTAAAPAERAPAYVA